MKLAFAGSPVFAATILKALVESDHSLAVIYTQPDRVRGRGGRSRRKPVPNAVKTLALDCQIPIEQPQTLKTPEAQAQFAEYAPDVFVVAAYGLILPASVLKLPAYGCINVHASLLPRWRGAAPIERAAMAGDSNTGISIMQMDEGLDTGPVYRMESQPIDYSATIELLEDQLASLGGRLLLEVLGDIEGAHRNQQQPEPPTPQAIDGVTYAHKLTADDRTINWEVSAEDIARQIWTLSKRMPVRCRLDNTGLQFLEAHASPETANHPAGTLTSATKHSLQIQCATGTLHVTRLRVEGGKGSVMTPAEALNGYQQLFAPGSTFV